MGGLPGRIAAPGHPPGRPEKQRLFQPANNHFHHGAATGPGGNEHKNTTPASYGRKWIVQP
jgi:hypothetical protein